MLKVCDTFPLTFEHTAAQIGMRDKPVDHFRHRARILVGEEDPGAIHRFRHGPGTIGHHGDIMHHAFDDGNTKPFVFTHAEKNIGAAVERIELVLRDDPGEGDRVGVQPAHGGNQQGMIIERLQIGTHVQ